jgi:hypothetical protein
MHLSLQIHVFLGETVLFINQSTQDYNQPLGCELKKPVAQCPKKTISPGLTHTLRNSEPLG